jgi:hypothetical protein
MKDRKVEELAREIHAIYQAEARRQHPRAKLKYPDDYDVLPNNVKDYDRAIARWILEGFRPAPTSQTVC